MLALFQFPWFRKIFPVPCLGSSGKLINILLIYFTGKQDSACSHSHDKNKFRSEIFLQLWENVIIIMKNYCLYNTTLHIKTHYRLTNQQGEWRPGKLFPKGANYSEPNWSINVPGSEPSKRTFGHLRSTSLLSSVIICRRFHKSCDWLQT